MKPTIYECVEPGIISEKDACWPSSFAIVKKYPILYAEHLKWFKKHISKHIYGLPENFGGSVSIEYASGEKISFSNNQQPILSPNTGLCIKELFSEAMKGEKSLFARRVRSL